MERLVKTVNVKKSLTILAKQSTLDVSKGPEYASDYVLNGLISGPYTNIWVGKTEVRHIRVVHVAPMNSLEHVSNQTT